MYLQTRHTQMAKLLWKGSTQNRVKIQLCGSVFFGGNPFLVSFKGTPRGKQKPRWRVRPNNSSRSPNFRGFYEPKLLGVRSENGKTKANNKYTKRRYPFLRPGKDEQLFPGDRFPLSSTRENTKYSSANGSTPFNPGVATRLGAVETRLLDGVPHSSRIPWVQAMKIMGVIATTILYLRILIIQIGFSLFSAKPTRETNI